MDGGTAVAGVALASVILRRCSIDLSSMVAQTKPLVKWRATAISVAAHVCRLACLSPRSLEVVFEEGGYNRAIPAAGMFDS